MTIEEIEKAALKYFLDTDKVPPGSGRTWEQVAHHGAVFAGQIHDAGLEKAAIGSIDAIVRDLSDRRGLRQEWEHIDNDIRDEILTVWRAAIRAGKVKP